MWSNYFLRFWRGWIGLMWLAQLDNFAFPFDSRQGLAELFVKSQASWQDTRTGSQLYQLESDSLNFAILLWSRWLSRSVWTMMNTKKMQLTSGEKKKKSADISFYRLPHNLHTLFSHLNVSIGSKPTLPPDLIQIDQPMWQPCVQLDTIICIFPLGIIKVFWL